MGNTCEALAPSCPVFNTPVNCLARLQALSPRLSPSITFTSSPFSPSPSTSPFHYALLLQLRSFNNSPDLGLKYTLHTANCDFTLFHFCFCNSIWSILSPTGVQPTSLVLPPSPAARRLRINSPSMAPSTPEAAVLGVSLKLFPSTRSSVEAPVRYELNFLFSYSRLPIYHL